MTSKLVRPERNSAGKLSTTASLWPPRLDWGGKLPLSTFSDLDQFRGQIQPSTRNPTIHTSMSYQTYRNPTIYRSTGNQTRMGGTQIGQQRESRQGQQWESMSTLGAQLPISQSGLWTRGPHRSGKSLSTESIRLRAQLRCADPQPAPMKADPLPQPSEMNKFYLFLFFWHAYSPVMYSLYKVDVQIPPPLPSAVQDSRKTPSLILKLRTGEYADGMCCVQLGSVLYFMGGEMNIDNPYIGKDLKKELHVKKKLHVKKELPKEVYYFDLATDHNYAGELKAGTPMKKGKARPLAFVANEKIYVIGSNNQDSDYFEMYDPKVDSWEFLQPPPIRNVNTTWVGHVVVRRKALMVAWQQEKERLYCFDFDTHEWANTSIPDYPGNFSGNTEFVGNTLYGCYYNTIAAIALKEEEEEAEEKELQKLFKHHCLHQVSKEMGMDAILNVPPQVQYSSRLLHLRENRFCYVRTGMPPHPDPDLASDLVIGDDKKRFISIVIFDAVGQTYKKDDTRFFKAKFLHSEHYEVNTLFPNEGFINGCYFLGSGYL